MNTAVYVDGFNLYYGALKNTSHEWLDLARLCQLLLPKNQITRIKYFTAKVQPRPTDPCLPVRQQIYLRAIKTIPSLEIIYGHFLSHEIEMPLAGCKPGEQKYVRVIKTEEKGSDVNLATHLVWDGFLDGYDVAVLITNDSDLVTPIRVVRRELKKPVIVLNPNPRKPSHELQLHASFVKPIRRGVIAASQFPPVLSDRRGIFRKPSVW